MGSLGPEREWDLIPTIPAVPLGCPAIQKIVDPCHDQTCCGPGLGRVYHSGTTSNGVVITKSPSLRGEYLPVSGHFGVVLLAPQCPWIQPSDG